MAIWGLDIQQTRQLASQMSTKASEIESILNTLTNALAGTAWEGPDATSFRNAWSGEHTAALRRVITALNDVSQQLNRNAAAQESTSQQA